MFCCLKFQNLIDHIGQRGISALVRKEQGEIMFMLQCRGINFDDLDKIKLKPAPERDIHINISHSTMMRYCPFCGYRLNKLAKANLAFFNDLVRDHEKFDDFQGL